MDRAVLCGDKVVVSRVIDREIDRQATSVDEFHALCFLLIDSASIHILLRGVCLSLELLEVTVLETLLHGPLHDSSVARDRNKGFGLVLALDPLNLPDDICVLVSNVLRGSEW